MAEIMVWEAIRRAHDEEMANDPMVIAMGEDIGIVGGTYKATMGLYDKYGEERVIDTPISENGYTGLGIGASFLGVRPIIEIMSVNFAWLAMDQMFNTAAKVRDGSWSRNYKYLPDQADSMQKDRPLLLQCHDAVKAARPPPGTSVPRYCSQTA